MLLLLLIFRCCYCLCLCSCERLHACLGTQVGRQRRMYSALHEYLHIVDNAMVLLLLLLLLPPRQSRTPAWQPRPF